MSQEPHDQRTCPSCGASLRLNPVCTVCGWGGPAPTSGTGKRKSPSRFGVGVAIAYLLVQLATAVVMLLGDPEQLSGEEDATALGRSMTSASGCLEGGAYRSEVDGLPAPRQGWVYLVVDVVVFPNETNEIWTIRTDDRPVAGFRRYQFTATYSTRDVPAEMRVPAETGLPDAGIVAAPMRWQLAFLVSAGSRKVTVRFDEAIGPDRRWDVRGPAVGQPIIPPGGANCAPSPSRAPVQPPGSLAPPAAHFLGAEPGMPSAASAARSDPPEAIHPR